MKRQTIKHEFVEFVPETLEDGTVYVSVPYATVVHLCCCGCEEKIITPISPAAWKLIYDGETISLHPSIGNWSYPCKSHYWIRRNQVEWASRLTAKQIAAGRARDRAVSDAYYGEEPHSMSEQVPPGDTTSDCNGLWLRLRSRLSR